MNRREFVKIALRLMAVWLFAQVIIQGIYQTIKLFNPLLGESTLNRFSARNMMQAYSFPVAMLITAVFLWCAAPRMARTIGGNDPSSIRTDSSLQSMMMVAMAAVGVYGTINAMDYLTKVLRITFADQKGLHDWNNILIISFGVIILASSLCLVFGANTVARMIISVRIIRRSNIGVEAPPGFEVIRPDDHLDQSIQ